MKSLIIATALVLGAAVLYLGGIMEPAQAQDICAQPIAPIWCWQTVPDRVIRFPPECRCPDVIIPDNLGINERIVVQTIPGAFSDTLVISKLASNVSAIPLEGNITGMSVG
jgi:hypothetical protein